MGLVNAHELSLNDHKQVVKEQTPLSQTITHTLIRGKSREIINRWFTTPRLFGGPKYGTVFITLTTTITITIKLTISIGTILNIVWRDVVPTPRKASRRSRAGCSASVYILHAIHVQTIIYDIYIYIYTHTSCVCMCVYM